MILLNSFPKNTLLLLVLFQFSCGKKIKPQVSETQKTIKTEQKQDTLPKSVILGAHRIYDYLPLLNGKRVGIVANQTSVIYKEENYAHLVDSLISLNVDVKKVFAPEHGFRGKVDAGELIKNGVDTKTGLHITSLYGKNKKPSNEQLSGLDVVIFDIQDVGARFYTYISSLHYVMEACAENNIKVIVLDRPNPNGHIVDGPTLELEHQSFIGMHPIPVLHGMTIGEYAKMINGENWLTNNAKCDLTVIKMAYYNRDFPYSLPIKPSPNLPNDKAINLYASLCFLEGTNISLGRGTEMQFQIYGSPFLPKTDFTFTPKPNVGSKYPKHENNVCYGFNLSKESRLKSINLSYLLNAYKLTEDKNNFFLKNGFFTTLAGTTQLQQQIESGLSASEIKATWQNSLDDFKVIRDKYLIYK
ncbi:exo-beta-N-acetylmuramidase NamZ domain-containing protein [Aurantibacter sp.]|uniref:exo-beta-N-acetylmuramidase NamZ family protein n=1 Tax=Aurantibacter sp. TaxID=2807103 RepID=UPI0035C7C16E